jgi:putative ABC transport system permease protein
VAPYLAVRRVAAAPRVASLLVAASGVAVGMLVFAGSLAASMNVAVQAKARTFLGSDVVVLLGGAVPSVPPGAPFPITAVGRASGGILLVPSEDAAEVLTIDRSTFARAAGWDSSFSSRPLTELLAAMAPRSDLRLPVIVVGHPSMVPTTVQIGNRFMALVVVAQMPAFPGSARDQPTLVVDEEAFSRATKVSQVPPSDTARAVELWARGNSGSVLGWLRARKLPILSGVSAPEVIGSPGFIALAWTFDFLQALGALTAAVSLIGMVLYLQARQRTREVAWALSRRMGLRRASGRSSLLLELTCLLGAAFVAGAAMAQLAARLVLPRLDPIPSIAPTLLPRLPVPLLAATAGGLLLAAVLGALGAARVAERTDVAKVMRLVG